MTTKFLKIVPYTAKEAEELIWFFIRSGNHFHNEIRYVPDLEAKKILERNNYQFDDIVRKLITNHLEPIPYFENLLSNTNANVSARQKTTSKVAFNWVIDGVEIPGGETTDFGIIRLDHEAQFISACRSRDRCIAAADYDEYLSMTVKMHSSIDSLLSLMAYVHKKKFDQCDFIDIDNKTVKLKDKIKKWIPHISGGWEFEELEKSEGWAAFLRTEKVRNAAVHPKPTDKQPTIERMCLGIMDFRHNSSMLFMIYKIFGLQIPSALIRAMQFPEVRTSISYHL